MRIEQELINESYRGFVREDLINLYQRFIGERSGGIVRNSSLSNEVIRGNTVNVSERHVTRQKKTMLLRFPRSIQIIKRYIEERYSDFVEVVYTVEYGVLHLIYFDENVLIDFSGDYKPGNREKLRVAMSGKIIGDNKFISVDRLENLKIRK